MGVVTDAAGGEDVGNAVDGAGSHEHFGLNERNLAHGVEVKLGGEVGDGFELFDVEVGAQVIA